MLAGAISQKGKEMALYKRGSTYWISFTTPGGKRIRRSAGTKNRKKAQLLFDKLKFEAWQTDSLGKQERYTWDEAVIRWLKRDDIKHISHNKSFFRWLTPHLRGFYLDEITRQKIMEIGEIKKAETSAATANQYMSLIRAVLGRAHKIWGWIEKVPSYQKFKEPPTRVRYLSREEIAALMAALPAYIQPVFMFSLLTGLRKSNVLNLRWDQVDLANSRIVIKGNEMKAGKTHMVPLTDDMKNILIAQVGKSSEYVFTNRGRKIKSVQKPFAKALRKTGITDYRWHDNRHTWASILVQNGVSLYELQEMGGWSSHEMVKRYAHLAPEKLKANAEIVSGFLKETVTNLSQ